MSLVRTRPSTLFQMSETSGDAKILVGRFDKLNLGQRIAEAVGAEKNKIVDCQILPISWR